MSSPGITLQESEFGGDIRMSSPDITLKDKRKEKVSTDEAVNTELHGQPKIFFSDRIKELVDHYNTCVELKSNYSYDKNAEEKGLVRNLDAIHAAGVQSPTQENAERAPTLCGVMKDAVSELWKKWKGRGRKRKAESQSSSPPRKRMKQETSMKDKEVRPTEPGADDKRGGMRELDEYDDYPPLPVKGFKPSLGIGKRKFLPRRCCKGYMVKKEVLGEGSYGVAILRTDERTGEEVVDKMMTTFNKEETERVEKEVFFLNSVKDVDQCITFHKYYVCSLTTGEIKDHHIIMDFFRGETLLSLMRRKFLTEDMKRKVLKVLGIGLQSIHRKRIIHCDLKSDNVLVNEDLEIRIIDFGVSQQGPTSQLYKGARYCKAPEIVRRSQQSDSEEEPRSYGYATDYFQLAHIAYEMEYLYAPFEVVRTCVIWDAHLRKATIGNFMEIFKDPFDIVEYPYSASEDYADLLEGLFETDPAVRLQDGTFLEHRYFNPVGGIMRIRQAGSVKAVNSPESLKHLTAKKLIQLHRDKVAKRIKATKNRLKQKEHDK